MILELSRTDGLRTLALVARAFLGLVACALLATSSLALAQDAAVPSSADSAPTAVPATSEETRARLAELEAEAARSEAQAMEWAAKTADFTEKREGAPTRLAELQAEVADLKSRETPSVDPDAPLPELETRLLSEQQDLSIARKDATELDADAAGRAERRKLIPERLAAAKERLRALEAESDVKGGDPAAFDARRRLTQARRQALVNEIASYEEELRSYDARGQLLTLRRERATQQIAALEAQVNALRTVLAARRQDQAEIAALEAERALALAEGMPPSLLEVVRELAEQNRSLALQRTGPDGLLQNIEETTVRLDRADQMVAEVTRDLDALRRNVETAGLTGSVGFLLRKSLSEIPDASMYRRFIRMRQDRISELQLEQLELLERRRALDNVEAAISARLDRIGDEVGADDRAAAQELLQSLVQTQSATLDVLIEDTETYFQKLVDFDARQQELVNRSDALKRFIDERILWVPSGAPLSRETIDDAGDALAWLFAARFWGQVPRAAQSAVAASPLMFAGALALLLAIPFAWPRIRTEITRLGEVARDPAAISIQPTAIALLLSLLLALWGPSLLAFVGWSVGASADATQFVRCIAAGLIVSAFVWATLMIPRQLLRDAGIAVAHLGWPEAPCRSLRRELRWLTIASLPAVFLLGVFDARAEEDWKESIGRFAFLFLMLAVLFFTHRILREKKGAFRNVVSVQRDLRIPSWIWPVLHGVSIVAIVSLMATAARGYYWTADQLAASIHVTLVFLFLMLFVHQIFTRWLLVASRKLALSRWEKAQAEHAARAGKKADPDAPGFVESEVELAVVDAQTGRLLRNGVLLLSVVWVWLIWADMLPAAGALRSVELWETSSTVTVSIVNPAGERISSVENRLVPVTLSDLLLALVIAAVTLALARNLAGLLEISLFRRLERSAGERYAYATIGKYSVTVAGFAAALQAVGVGWNNIQWMVAAVSIGLGFGLQEIFANFISGLIILFERPIRVGDTVTVGDISGTVSRIRIRATWITGFDRKELVVPNKEFITTRLVNWSLSDATLRIEIPVGVAYGSDTDRALRVLLEVAVANQHVLRDPPPIALFRGFGDSSLNLELRVFSPDVSHYLRIVHELHLEIDRAFRKEKIEIAFPQRDLHVRSMPVPRSEGEGDPS